MQGWENHDPYSPCPCGSGKKYKFCCRERDRAGARERVREAFMPGRLAAMDLDESVRLAHEGSRRIAENDLEGARACLERAVGLCPLNPVAHNNMATLRFYEGDILAAVEIAERVVENIDSNNDFTLGMLVHFYLLLGRDGEAASAAGRMMKVKAEEETHLVKQCEALARLCRHEDVLARAGEGMRRFRGDAERIFAFFAGTALANMSDFDGAARLLESARGSRDCGPLVSRYLDLLAMKKRPPTIYCAWPYLGPPHWINVNWLIDLAKEKPAKEEMKKRAPYLAGIRHFVDAFLVLEDDHRPRKKPRKPGFAETVVEMLGFVGTPEAVQVLRDIASSMYGDEDLRMKAAGRIRELDALGEEEELDMFVGGKWRKIRMIRHEVGDDYDLPEGALGLYKDAISASRSGKLGRAEELNRRFVESYPQYRQGYHNLAATLFEMGGKDRREEARRLLEKALEIDPSYIFPKCTMANILVLEGKREEAKKFFDGVDVARDLKVPGEMVYFNVSRLRLLELEFTECLEEIAKESARGTDVGEKIDALARIAELMGDITESLERMRKQGEAFELPPISRISRELHQVLSKGALERNRSLRSRIVSPGATIREVLADYTVPELRLVGRRLGVRRSGACRKEKLLDEISERLSDEKTLSRLMDGLGKEERRVFGALLESGGAMDVVSFSRRFEYKEDENFIIPLTAAGRLRAAGIISEGFIGGKESVFVAGPIAEKVAGAAITGTRAGAGRIESAGLKQR